MTIVGFNFNKIRVEKNDTPGGKVNISNNVSIKDVTDASLSLGGENQKSIKFVFEFISKYEPKLGEIFLGGEVLYLEDKKNVEKIQAQWKENKKIEKPLMASILNTVLLKCNVQALILSQDVSLPSPIQLPKVKMTDEE